MMLDSSTLDLSEAEREIGELLLPAEEPDANVQSACSSFAYILIAVFGTLPKRHPWRSWQLDDLWCEAVSRSDHQITLSGIAYWLSGGGRCERFRLDIDLNSAPLLYSYKFTIRKTGRQVLYAGKTPGGWLVNGA